MTAHIIPADIRAEVIERDGQCCRVCGQFVSEPGLHHITYLSEGGLDVVENLVTIGWRFEHDCHLKVVHANKRIWQPIMRQVAITPAVTGRQLLRWYRSRS